MVFIVIMSVLLAIASQILSSVFGFICSTTLVAACATGAFAIRLYRDKLRVVAASSALVLATLLMVYLTLKFDGTADIYATMCIGSVAFNYAYCFISLVWYFITLSISSKKDSGKYEKTVKIMQEAQPKLMAETLFVAILLIFETLYYTLKYNQNMWVYSMMCILTTVVITIFASVETKLIIEKQISDEASKNEDDKTGTSEAGKAESESTDSGDEVLSTEATVE